MNDTSALALDCLRIACAVIKGHRMILMAGPMVLWSDGVVYAITSCGGVPRVLPRYKREFGAQR